MTLRLTANIVDRPAPGYGRGGCTYIRQVFTNTERTGLLQVEIRSTCADIAPTSASLLENGGIQFFFPRLVGFDRRPDVRVGVLKRVDFYSQPLGDDKPPLAIWVVVKQGTAIEFVQVAENNSVTIRAQEG